MASALAMEPFTDGLLLPQYLKKVSERPTVINKKIFPEFAGALYDCGKACNENVNFYHPFAAIFFRQI